MRIAELNQVLRICVGSMGVSPTLLDALAFELLTNVIRCLIESVLERHARSLEILTSLC